ncbi:hypothetical protein [Streptomyces althioticus]|uniref:hypothetical protein n=1 Tax=Streptomyces althioticus TaxID=83380 RepID=UPI0033F54CEF
MFVIPVRWTAGVPGAGGVVVRGGVAMEGAVFVIPVRWRAGVPGAGGVVVRGEVAEGVDGVVPGALLRRTADASDAETEAGRAEGVGVAGAVGTSTARGTGAVGNRRSGATGTAEPGRARRWTAATGTAAGAGTPPSSFAASPEPPGCPTGARPTAGAPVGAPGVTEGRAERTGASAAVGMETVAPGPPDGPEGSGVRAAGAPPPDRAARRCTAGAVRRRGTAADAGRRCGATGDSADGGEGASARVGVRGRTGGAAPADTGDGAWAVPSGASGTARCRTGTLPDSRGTDVTGASPDTGEPEAAPATGGTDDGEDVEAAEDVERATGTGDGEGDDKPPGVAARGSGAFAPGGGAVNGAPSRGRRRGADAVPPLPPEPAGSPAGPEPEPRVSTGTV